MDLRWRLVPWVSDDGDCSVGWRKWERLSERARAMLVGMNCEWW